MELNYTLQLLVEADTQRCCQHVLKTGVKGAWGIAVVLPGSCGKLGTELGPWCGSTMLLCHALIEPHVLPGESSVKL